MTNGNGNGVKSRAAEWLFQQGSSTVILFAIFGLLVWSVPQVWTVHERIEKSARQERDDERTRHAVERKDDREARKHDMDRLTTAFEKNLHVLQEIRDIARKQ